MAATQPEFIHLHVHTQYSLLDGAIRIDSLLKRVKEFNMDAVAVTDHGTMFGAIEFYDKAVKAGIKPIIGCECYVAPRSLTDKTPMDHKGLSHLVLIASNLEGYQNLCKLASVAQLEGFYYKPRIDKKILAAHSRGLIGLSACLHGEIPMKIRSGEMQKADDVALAYQDIFGAGNFFLEVQNNGIEVQEKVNETLRDMSARLDIPLVASNDCHYLSSDDVHAHDVLLCIQTGKTVTDTDRLRFRTDQLYFKSPLEMETYFRDYPGALANTVKIAQRCQIEFDFNTYHFPQFDVQSGLSIDDHFNGEVRKGFARRLEIIRRKNPDIDEAVYRQRLEYEIKTIIEMGFPGYFLIVADFIRFGKENGVPVGPGRGSAAGSIVAYSLGITDLDPIEHGLIFERFLNPARSSMPDIDVDFCINGREKVFKYVVDRYGGGDYVAQIITFGKLKTRAVIRDVGRALDIPLHEVDTIAKLVPDVLNIGLEEALHQEPKIRKLVDEKPEIANLIKICKVLEGLPRHASTHAAGVVIGDRPLVEYLPLYRGKKGEVVTQFDMKRVEQIGLVKFDFLGLRNLTVIEDTLKLIRDQGKTAPDLLDLDMQDEATYRLLSAGNTTGVFQLESSGMKELLTRLKPECFDDVTALVALYRPGPLDSGMVDDYVECKHGRKAVEYTVPELEPILKETHGVILYQEQVMKIAGVLANYSMADADGLRKAMGKKIAEMMAKHRDQFVEGSVANGIPRKKAAGIFDLMEKFGGYGFNKSHSAAYALIAYQTAYLKTHFPVEFMAALLTSEMNSTDGVVKYISECRKHSIPVQPPDINESEIAFAVSGAEIRFGLVAVKNVGEGAIEAILEARQEGRFTSIFDFVERADLKKVNKRVVESLIKCGAFDSLGTCRSRLFACLEDAIEYGQRVQRENADPQMGLFDNPSNGQKPVANTPQIPAIDEWGGRDLLAYEKEYLGFYITGHPLDRYKDTIEKFTNADAVSLLEMQDGGAVRVGGLITAVKTIRTKKGELMAFVTLEDLLGTTEVVVFPEVYAHSVALLIEDGPILVQGQLQLDENNAKILAEKVVDINLSAETWSAAIHFHFDADRTRKESFHLLRDILSRHTGDCRCYIHVLNGEATDTVIELPDRYAVSVGPDLKEDIGRNLECCSMTTTCKPVTLEPRPRGNGFSKTRNGR